MIGFGFAWLFLSFLNFLLIRVVLRRESLEGKQRLQAVSLGMIACLFMAVCGLSTWSLFDWSSIYSEPPLERSDQLSSEGETWSRFRGEISQASRLNLEEKGYAAYIELDSALPGRGSVDWVSGKGILLELADQTLLEVPDLRFASDYDWNWHAESNYRFLVPGDSVTVPGCVYRLSEPSESGATHVLRDIEFVHRGSESEYLESGLKQWKEVEGYVFLALTGLFVLSLVVSSVGLLSRWKAPTSNAEPE